MHGQNDNDMYPTLMIRAKMLFGPQSDQTGPYVKCQQQTVKKQSLFLFFYSTIVTERRPIKKKVIPFLSKSVKVFDDVPGENFAQCGIIAADPSPSEEGGKDQKKKLCF